jgi:ornithine cyclodeaminase
MRTAAGSALSARLLARADASVLTIVGTGVQARSHARVLPLVRDFTEIRIWGRDPSAIKGLVDELRGDGLPVVAAVSGEQAVDGADVVCAATHADKPVIDREWVSAGTHITSVGYNAAGREVDDATVVDAYVVVESRTAALAPPPSGTPDLTEPIRKGLITADHVKAEIGELVLGTQPGRSSDGQITLYKSVGVAVQDAAAAALVLAAARSAGMGREFEITSH